ncbi:MAG: hypothetical protein AAF705_01790 [Bacteroidota bacterium]
MNRLSKILKAYLRPSTARCTFLMLVLCLWGNAVFAQDEALPSPQNEYLKESLTQRPIKESKWKRATKGLDYTPPKVKQRRARQTDNRPTGNARGLLTLLAVILIAVIIALIIAGWSGYLKPKPKKIKAIQVSIEDIEENLFESNLQGLLQEAINKRQYNLAIRLYFLEILKMLALQKKIKWKKEKTNRIYFYELNNSGFSEAFQKLSTIFDRIRYGGVDLDESDFRVVEPAFKIFLDNLQKAEAR